MVTVEGASEQAAQRVEVKERTEQVCRMARFRPRGGLLALSPFPGPPTRLESDVSLIRLPHLRRKDQSGGGISYMGEDV